MLKKTVLFIATAVLASSVAMSCGSSSRSSEPAPDDGEVSIDDPVAEEDGSETAPGDPRTSVPGGIVAESADGAVLLPDGTPLHSTGSLEDGALYEDANGTAYMLSSVSVRDGEAQYVFAPAPSEGSGE